MVTDLARNRSHSRVLADFTMCMFDDIEAGFRLGSGDLDHGLEEAKAHGWTVVDIKRDWRQVFPFER